MKYVEGMGWVWNSLEHNEIEALRKVVTDLRRQLAEVTRGRDEWKKCYEGQREVYNDIGAALEAKMPEELVNEVARRRMIELAEATRQRDTYKAMLDLQNLRADRANLENGK